MDFLYKQFEMSRHMFLREVNQTNQGVLDVQPNGFSNNIHWQVGHVLTVTEQFLFGFPNDDSNLPQNYKDLFGNGSSPAAWPDNVPSVDELTEQLQKQLERMKEIPKEKFNEQLPEPFLGAETFGELAALAVVHESNHAGRVNAMKKAIG
ncbi:DinB family protein [Lentibacillus cibarius]|uniref:DinB family protein n=1 Tax=Lentibacillus cibarius TaxID=2583219 RepID=A0A549YGF6_9BACI|nr:DinB family protein [Lentibacillus cibarius]TMN22141.1 DinB family protein [Lentibacillus cibarius]TRM10917.1 DinB family protein [Lentibacillus cibarius]